MTPMVEHAMHYEERDGRLDSAARLRRALKPRKTAVDSWIAAVTTKHQRSEAVAQNNSLGGGTGGWP